MNEQTETIEEQSRPAKENDTLPASSHPADSSNTTSVTPQTGCTTCGVQGGAIGPNATGAGPVSYVYAIGRVEARFPNLAAEKEFAQATGRTDTAGKTDRQTLQAVLSQRENRYLIRQLCWVLTIQGLDTYLLLPRDPADTDLLVGAIRLTTSPNDIDVVIGIRGPIAPPTMCNGLMVPIILFGQI